MKYYSRIDEEPYRHEVEIMEEELQKVEIILYGLPDDTCSVKRYVKSKPQDSWRKYGFTEEYENLTPARKRALSWLIEYRREENV